MKSVTVELGDRSYPVIIGRDVLGHVDTMIPDTARRIAIVTQDGIPSRLVPAPSGVEVSIHHVGQGEQNKTMGTIERLCGEFSHVGLTRADVVVGVGGGMVTDIAGFAAAVYHRGVRVVHVATSLLAMVDAAIGGKTGVNLGEGKNLVGAFWQPSGVVCDVSALDSLPEREMRCGAGEMAKYHFIVRDDLSALALEERIARCVEIKASVVSADEREGGRRALLNYGHTLAHALEIATNFSIAHGEAVSVGLLYAAELARSMGRIDAERVAEHYRVVHEVYGLRNSLPHGVSIEGLMVDMARDKKALGAHTFVLDGENGLEVVSHVTADHMRAAYVALEDRLGE